MKSKQPKTEILRTRVSPEEREQIEHKALLSYRTVSRYLRDTALDKPIVIINGVDELADELRRIGNNLNQITRQWRQPIFPEMAPGTAGDGAVCRLYFITPA